MALAALFDADDLLRTNQPGVSYLPEGSFSRQRSIQMAESRSTSSGYVITALIGAVAGGISVLVLTRAIPNILSQMMPTMMQNMMTQMGGEGCDPEDM